MCGKTKPTQGSKKNKFVCLYKKKKKKMKHQVLNFMMFKFTYRQEDFVNSYTLSESELHNKSGLLLFFFCVMKNFK